jgi:hypothetical protein
MTCDSRVTELASLVTGDPRLPIFSLQSAVEVRAQFLFNEIAVNLEAVYGELFFFFLNKDTAPQGS